MFTGDFSLYPSFSCLQETRMWSMEGPCAGERESSNDMLKFLMELKLFTLQGRSFDERKLCTGDLRCGDG